MKIKATKIIGIVTLVMLIFALSAFTISASSTQAQDNTTMSIGVIPEFEFVVSPHANLDDIGFPYEALRAAFPDTLEVKYENGKYMVKDIGAEYAEAYSTPDYNGTVMTLVDGWWIYEINEQKYNDEDVFVEFFGEGGRWTINYENGSVYGNLNIQCNEYNTVSVYYGDYSRLEFSYYVGDKYIVDSYRDGELDGETVNVNLYEHEIYADYNADGSFYSAQIFTRDGEWIYYNSDTGWYKFIEGETVACDIPSEIGNTEYLTTIAPTSINCTHSNYSDATCTEPKMCTTCGKIEQTPLGHTPDAAFCDTPEICRVCGEITNDTTVGHNFGGDGICTVCGVNSQNVITIKMEDSYSDGWDSNAIEVYKDGKLINSYTINDGSSASVELYYFPDSQYEFYWVSGSYPEDCSFNIDFGNGTVFTATSEDCFSYFDGYRIYPECQHVYSEGEVIEETCTNQGYTILTCTICNITKNGNYVDSLGGHKEGEVVEVVEPNCTDDGYTTYVCTVCGENFDSDYIDALGHTKDVDTKAITDPTCDNRGYTSYSCSECDEFIYCDYKDILGHTLGNDGNCTVCHERFSIPVWLGDVQITVDNMADILGDGTASYDLETNTLTLSGFNYESNEEIDALYSRMSLNILIKGENTIESGASGFFFDILDGTVNILGDGSLTFITKYESIYCSVINHLNLVIGGDVVIDFQPINDEPIYILSDMGGADLVIKDNAELILGTEGDPISEEGIYIYCLAEATLTIKDNAKLSVETTDEEGIYAYSDEVSSVTVSDNATVYIIANEEGIEADIITITGGNITVTGGEGYQGIDAEEVVISGGIVNASTTDDEICAIEAGKLTISGGAVTTNGNGAGVYVYGEFIITGGTLSIKGGGLLVNKYDEESATYVPGIITIGENMCISAPEGASISVVTNGEYIYSAVVNSNGTVANSLVISCKHNWQSNDNDCTADVVCTLCGKLLTKGNEAHIDSDNNGKCDACDKDISTATPNIDPNPEIGKEPGTDDTNADNNGKCDACDKDMSTAAPDIDSNPEIGTEPSTDDTNAGNNENDGLDTGAIVAIAAVATVVGGAGIFALVWSVIKKKTWAE